VRRRVEPLNGGTVVGWQEALRHEGGSEEKRIEEDIRRVVLDLGFSVSQLLVAAAIIGALKSRFHSSFPCVFSTNFKTFVLVQVEANLFITARWLIEHAGPG